MLFRAFTFIHNGSCHVQQRNHVALTKFLSEKSIVAATATLSLL